MELHEAANRAGVATEYHGLSGELRTVPDETVEAVLAAIGPEGEAPGYRVVEANAPVDPELTGEAEWRLTYEDGVEIEGRGSLPPLPLGRHCLHLGGRDEWLLSAPKALPLPERCWGMTLPLYGLRGAERGGLADYADLAVAVEALAGVGAGFVGLNPVHAGFGADPFHISPYSPSHRRRLSTHYIPVAGDAEGAGGLVDYKASLPVRQAALDAAYAVYEDDGRFARFQARADGLRAFATYEALAEVHGPNWNTWPAAFREPTSKEVHAFAQERHARVRFHEWLQFRAWQDLIQVGERAKDAGLRHGLYLDLAVGTHPYGAETWAERESFAEGVSLGAPPDAFAEDGQRWGLAPFNPRALVASGFKELAETLRWQMRFAGMLRVDHILGFERAFWLPEGLPGTYVAMPRDAMLAVLRIEAARAGCIVVGEDLGNVPDGLRWELSERGVLGCDVAMFEPGKRAEHYRERALASFGTHDLPTWIGWREGRDIAARLGIGEIDEGAAGAARDARRADVQAFQEHTGGDVHGFLARTTARLVAVQAEDVFEAVEQSNLPGTVESHPNWRRRVPVDVEDWAGDERLRRVGQVMHRAGR
ncbi:MAG: 4-alpha-glucanotransferase [Pseudomonadota bacterium]